MEISERYVTRFNRCDCHPETCCCATYKIIDTTTDEQTPLFTMNDKEAIKELCIKLNIAESVT